MEDIADRMRAATADPPPTSIDIGRLIAGEQHRSRQLRWAASAGGVAGAVATVVFATTVLPGQGGEPASPGLPAVDLCAPVMAIPSAMYQPDPSGMAQPSGTSQPDPSGTSQPDPSGTSQPEQSYPAVRPLPTGPTSEAVSRLSMALDDAFATQLPDMRVIPFAQPGCERPQFQYHPEYKGFITEAKVDDGKGYGLLHVELIPNAARSRPDCDSVPDGRTCEDRKLPGGGTARVETLSTGSGGARSYLVEIDRPDGTTARLVTDNVRGGASTLPPSQLGPALTVDQMIALGSTPELTLYP